MKPLGTIPKWNSTLAYAIGLITTDGSLSCDRRHINFTSKDKQLVQTFMECLELKNKIGRKSRAKEQIKRYYQVQFGNVILYNWLVELGLKPNKSKTLGTLKIPDDYFADFLRGHLDGDGSIKVYQDPIWPNSQRIYVTFLSASSEHINWLRYRIESLFGVIGFMRTAPRVFVLTYSKRESLKLLPSLYYRQDIPCLERKHKIAENIFKKQAGVAELARRATFRA